MKIAIIGTGYVGLVTGACFASLGNHVTCVDKEKAKILSLKAGNMPIYEPGLEELVKESVARGRLSFTDSIKDATEESSVIFICVGTPPRDDGSADLTNIEHVSQEIAKYMDSYKLIVEKSTVPVETGEWVKRTIAAISAKERKGKHVEFDIASNPEFLREGSAIYDFMNPDRIVIGTESEKARSILEELYKPFNAPIVSTSIKGAEIIKHAANSFLATKISFINAVANICDRVGADVEEVARGIGLDKRISEHFLKAGLGFGGFCFPKDLKAFIHIADTLGYKFNLLKEVEKINESQKEILISKIKSVLSDISGKNITVLGLSFKPNTDDIRFSPSISVIKKLLKEKVNITVYDPCAMEKTKLELGERIKYSSNLYDAVKGSDSILIMTEWNEFKELDFNKIKKLMKKPVIVDGRNMYDPKRMKKIGFTYKSIGRGEK